MQNRISVVTLSHGRTSSASRWYRTIKLPAHSGTMTGQTVPVVYQHNWFTTTSTRSWVTAILTDKEDGLWGDVLPEHDSVGGQR